MSRTNGHIKQKGIDDLDGLLDDGDEIAEVMRRFHTDIVEDAFLDAESLGASFSLENVHVQRVLGRLARQVRSVSSTTKDEIQRLVGLQAAEGWSIEELAAAIEQLAETRSKTRALTIARTETGTAYNLASLAAYRDAGITHVTVLDGDEDEPCRSANGSRWTIEEAEANPLGHPNCSRAFVPIVED